MSCHSFVSRFLREISIILILIFYLNFPTSDVLDLLLLSIFSLATLEKFVFVKKVYDRINIMKSIYTSIVNLTKRDLARVRKIC